MVSIIEEYRVKRDRISHYMNQKNIEAVLLNDPSNYFWLTCGRRNKVADFLGNGASSLLIFKDKLFLVTTNIEIERMIDEETNNFDFIKPLSYKWYKPEDFLRKIEEIVSVEKIHQDLYILKKANMLDKDFNALKYCLTDNEKIRYYQLGKETAECMTETCMEIKPEMKEYEVQALLSKKLISKEILPWLVLVASDDRVLKYKHPIPTNKSIENFIMVVVGALRHGLIACCTRLLHFGAPTKQILKARDIITRIDAELILFSRPGIKYAEIFKNEVQRFESYGLKHEWENHHQGGPIGYEGRYFVVDTNTKEIIQKNNAIAWNPSMVGFKSEDTIIVEDDHNIIATYDDNWPMLKIDTELGKIKRPDILIR